MNIATIFDQQAQRRAVIRVALIEQAGQIQKSCTTQRQRILACGIESKLRGQSTR
jgi:hypothetical protein